MRTLALAAALVALLIANGAHAARYDSAIRAKFGARAPAALCISHAEDPSRGLAQWSPTHDVGLFQIHVDYGAAGRTVGSGPWRRYFTIAQLETLDGNLAAASILSNNGAQWRAWTTHGGCGV